MRDEVLFRPELTHAYSDPTVGPRSILAYVPELHASANCSRAIKGGMKGVLLPRKEAERANLIWCLRCTTDDYDEATLHRVNGHWVPIRQPEDTNPTDVA
jgi:hypothetical protein